MKAYIVCLIFAILVCLGGNSIGQDKAYQSNSEKAGIELNEEKGKVKTVEGQIDSLKTVINNLVTKHEKLAYRQTFFHSELSQQTGLFTAMVAILISATALLSYRVLKKTIKAFEIRVDKKIDAMKEEVASLGVSLSATASITAFHRADVYIAGKKDFRALQALISGCHALHTEILVTREIQEQEEKTTRCIEKLKQARDQLKHIDWSICRDDEDFDLRRTDILKGLDDLALSKSEAIKSHCAHIRAHVDDKLNCCVESPDSTVMSRGRGES